MSILTETQLDRDKELAKLLRMKLEDVQKLPIASVDAIRVCSEEKAKTITPEEYYKLYSEYTYLNWPAYMRTLMKTSATRRHPELFKLLKETKNKVCLDFGSGTATHSIALFENKNYIELLDVPGKLQEFAKKRLINRNIWMFVMYSNDEKLPENKFDVVICSDTLEHVASPLKELKRIHKAMKKDGLLHLLVSTMRKESSGHFGSSIDEWIKEGKLFVKNNFVEIRPTIYRKK